MKTQLHRKPLRGKALFLLASIFMLFFTMESRAQGCFAGFSYYTTGNVVVFIDSSFVNQPDSITSYAWAFGDNSFGTGPSVVTHQYNAAGTYTACLTITTALGCVNTSCQQIFISGNPCTLTANILPDSSGTGLYVATSGGTPPYTYLWSTGSTNFSISTLLPGLYCVTVTDINGCSATDCDSSGAPGCNPYFGYTNQGSIIGFQNYSSGTYDSLMWDFGDGQFSNLLNPVHTYTLAGVYTVCLILYDNGSACNSYCQSVVIQPPFNSTLCGSVFVDVNGNGVFDSTDTYLSNQYIAIYGNGFQFTALTDSNGNYSVNVPAGTYTISYCPNNFGAMVTLPIDSSPFCGVYYSVTVTANQTLCGYNFAIQYTSVTIEGTVFADLNNNGILDVNESGIPYQLVSVGAYNAYTNSNGQYSIFIPAGTYSITYSPQGAYAPYALTTPGSISLNAGTVGSTYSGNNFGLNIPPGTTDISVMIFPHTTVTPGFPAWYDIYICNNGVTPVAANVTMLYDPALIFNYANPTEATLNTTTHTITWVTPVITPGNCETIWVDFDADSALALNVPTLEFVSAYPVSGSDIDLSNNTDTVHQVSGGSWDPNNKLSIQTNTTDPNKQFVSSVNPNQEIQYTVNFQNTGTGPAVNVVVIDQLSGDLDANSFQLAATSHPCTVTRSGSQVNYTFSNIMLPDSGSNQVGSHGFISFKANANSNLTAGTVLSDNASIYFDFNTAVVTGNTHIVMIDPLGVSENENVLHTINTYPNPVKDQTTIDYTLSSEGQVILDVMDMNGKVCKQLVNEKQGTGAYSVNWTSELQAGHYLVRLQVDGAVSMTKISVVK